MGFENCEVEFEKKNELGNGIGNLPYRTLCSATCLVKKRMPHLLFRKLLMKNQEFFLLALWQARGLKRSQIFKIRKLNKECVINLETIV